MFFYPFKLFTVKKPHTHTQIFFYFHFFIATTEEKIKGYCSDLSCVLNKIGVEIGFELQQLIQREMGELFLNNKMIKIQSNY